ncbi:hypothetical protein SLEP1_g31517 [Rubroshorea leprosula]|uniref:Uncharacterized protein n=1 Tax=Rubroshorea leprosula TaxID=152421 RepID=A0AAV5KAI3_9ROSI|nr:hypothetical protein SLEP1_g31517 [Rubroshorea leprosula]
MKSILTLRRFTPLQRVDQPVQQRYIKHVAPSILQLYTISRFCSSSSRCSPQNVPSKPPAPALRKLEAFGSALLFPLLSAGCSCLWGRIAWVLGKKQLPIPLFLLELTWVNLNCSCSSNFWETREFPADLPPASSSPCSSGFSWKILVKLSTWRFCDTRFSGIRA